jgi:DNA (cytosine-5)-methyltransferase 1
MKDVWIKKIGENKGRPRIYLDGLQAVRAGFAPGERFEVIVDEDGRRVILQKNRDGTRRVSMKERGGKQYPVIDINSSELLGLFEGMDVVRMVVGTDSVYILPLASEVKKKERLARLTTKLRAGEPLAVGSLAHGGGILAHAVHQGLQAAGVDCHLAFANEIREDLLAHAAEHNDAWGGGGTAAVNLPMQEAVQDDWLMSRLPLLEVLEVGQPCSGASKAGRAKRGGGHAENHPEVGHLIFSTLVIIARTQPAAVLLECVPGYACSASADILRNQLRDAGYKVHEAILQGRDFGSLENRIRWCCVGVTQGVEFSFERLVPAVREVRTVADILDPSIGPDDELWRTVDYLKSKRERDEAKGSRFHMQFVQPTDSQVPVLRKAYYKGGSTDPRLVHPTDPERSRLFTHGEVARIKGVDETLVQGLSRTQAIEVLGQGIVYEPFRAAAQRIGEALLRAAERVDEADLGTSQVARRRERMTG